jgi:hypothetical protein
MTQFRDNGFRHSTRHAVTMQNLRLHLAAAIMAVIVKVASEKEVAP